MRTRDDLYDALDQLPRPVKESDTSLYYAIESVGDPGSYVSSQHSSEDLLMAQYFTSLPAEEKISA